MTITEQAIDVQRELSGDWNCPDDAAIANWAHAALATGSAARPDNTGLTVRIVELDEMQQSNKQWRGVDRATNVLSFPAEFPAEAGIEYLGDIMICAPVIEQESTAQGKPCRDHWAHIVVHGVLHLQGFDHENDQEAAIMEKRETEILATLGIADPYSDFSSVPSQ